MYNESTGGSIPLGSNPSNSIRIPGVAWGALFPKVLIWSIVICAMARSV